MSYARSIMALFACFCLAPHMAIASAEPPTPPAREVKILAHGAWPYLPVYAAIEAPRKLQQWVFRDDKELAAAAGPHGFAVVARALKTDAIDFKKDMLLAVADGTQPLVGISGGPAPSAPNRIEVGRVSMDEKGKIMTVRWRLVPREAGTPIITAPLEVVLVPRFDGKVRFEREAAATKDKEEAPTGMEIKISGRAFWPDGWRAEEPARQWIVRRYEDLIDPRIEANETILERMRKENADRYAKALKVDAIDFHKQMIVGISGGVQPSGGYRMKATKAVIDAEGKRMTVYWKLHSPDRDAKVAPAPTHPAEVVLVAQFAGEVRFEEESAPKP
jgi:hypothetical protein